MVKIKLTWGKEKYELEINPEEPVTEFRAIIYSLTSVPPENQKLLYKGTNIKDDTNLPKLKIKENGTMMLIGAAVERQITELKSKKFEEDMSEQEIAAIMKKGGTVIIPAGLYNLGNTCYLNSTIHCLQRINELKDHLTTNFQGNNTFQKDAQLSQSLGQLFKQLGNSQSPIQPQQLVMAFMQSFPQFAEKQQGGGGFRQQDADEAFSNIVQSLSTQCMAVNQENEKYNLIEHIFQIDWEVTFKNVELPEEEASVRQESSRKLLCTIQHTAKNVDNLMEGIELSLQEEIQKTSDFDNNIHLYHKISRINKLPNYLAVQMIRFNWKQASSSSGTQATKAKILRQVAYPKILDVFNICSDKLKADLKHGREYEKKQQEEAGNQDKDKFEEWKKKNESEGKMMSEDSKQLYLDFKKENAQAEIKEHDDNLYRTHGTGLDTGSYQLTSILTHKGRSADSGHYVAWTHVTGDVWMLFDDDQVTEKKLEEVLNLKGGGDWHMAYFLIYRKLEIM